MQLLRVYVGPEQTMPVRGVETGWLLATEKSVAAKVRACRLDFQAWLLDQYRLKPLLPRGDARIGHRRPGRQLVTSISLPRHRS